MGDGVSGDALSRLKSVTGDAGRVVVKVLEPVDEAIREIDVAFRASHYAEDCRDWDPPESGRLQAHAGRFAFAIESTGERATEYCLCAARGPDGRCGLYVSVCEYHQEAGPDGTDDRIVVDRIYLVRSETLSLALRAQMLDELSQGNFVKAYEAHLAKSGEDDAVIRPWLPTRGK